MARRQVDAEIKADPITIIPHRKTKIADGAGGWTWSPPLPQEPITGTLIPAKRRLTDMLVNTELGDVVNAPYVFLAPSGSDLKRQDTFTWNDDEFVVTQKVIKTEVSITASVDYVGGGDTNG